MTWLGISPEFWKMPFLPPGLLAVTAITTVTQGGWKGKKGKGEDRKGEKVSWVWLGGARGPEQDSPLEAWGGLSAFRVHCRSPPL